MFNFHKFSVCIAAVKSARRAFSSTAATNTAKVAVLGAAGGIGQPLSLLLKHNELISHLSLYDIVNTPGVAADLSHINTNSKVSKHIYTMCTYIFFLISIPSIKDGYHHH